MGDVNGFFDINAGKYLNKEMGLDGKNLHSIGDYASAVANQPSEESTGESSQNDSQGIVNPSSIHAEGQIQLSNGTIDAGSASMQLAGTGGSCRAIGNAWKAARRGSKGTR